MEWECGSHLVNETSTHQVPRAWSLCISLVFCHWSIVLLTGPLTLLALRRAGEGRRCWAAREQGEVRLASLGLAGPGAMVQLMGSR